MRWFVSCTSRVGRLAKYKMIAVYGITIFIGCHILPYYQSIYKCRCLPHPSVVPNWTPRGAFGNVTISLSSELLSVLLWTSLFVWHIGGYPATLFLPTSVVLSHYLPPYQLFCHITFHHIGFIQTFLSAFAKLWKRLIALSCLAVHLSAWNNLAVTGWIFMKFGLWRFLK